MTKKNPPLLNWEDETVLIIGTGESLTQTQIDIINKLSYRKIAVNDAIFKIKNPDIHYACDRKWWDYHYKSLPRNLKTIKVSLEDTNYSDVYKVENVGANPGFARVFPQVNNGRNSCYQACNLAWHYGVKRIILCGVDMHGTHYFGPHPQGLRNTTNFNKMIELFSSLLKEEVEIINCSPISKLTFFPYKDIQCV